MGRPQFRRIYTTVFSNGDLPNSITWTAGMDREEFETWKEWVFLTVRVAERNIIDFGQE